MTLLFFLSALFLSFIENYKLLSVAKSSLFLRAISLEISTILPNIKYINNFYIKFIGAISTYIWQEIRALLITSMT